MIVMVQEGHVVIAAMEQVKMENVFSVRVLDTVTMVLAVFFVMALEKTIASHVTAKGIRVVMNVMARVKSYAKIATVMVNCDVENAMEKVK